MNEKKLAQYVEIEEQFKKLEEKREALRTEILEDMLKSKTEKIEKGFGIFSVGRRASWKYSSKVEKLLETVKVAKAMEEQKGIAKKTETEYLRFTIPSKE